MAHTVRRGRFRRQGRRGAAPQQFRRRLLPAEPLEPRRVLDGTLVINEILADNAGVWLDDQGNSSDFIELYNPSTEPVNTDGWYLTDDSDELDKWRMPAMTIPPSGYLVVAASGLNRDDPSQQLHTNFSLSAAGEYLAVVNADGAIVDQFDPYPLQRQDIAYGPLQSVAQFIASDGTIRYHVPTAADQSIQGSWHSPDFDDSSWQTGQLSVGFGRSEPGFNVRLIDLAGEGAGRVNTTTQALLVATGQFDPADYQIVADVTGPAEHVDFGSGSGTFPQTLDFPITTDEDGLILEVTAKVTIPEGEWTIGFGSDDGGMIRLDGVPLTQESNAAGDTPGDDILWYEWRRGHDWTTAQLTVGPGGVTADLYGLMFQIDGSSSLEIAIRPGHHEGDVNANDWLLLENGAFGWQVERPSSINTDVRQAMEGASSLWARIDFDAQNPQGLDSLVLRTSYDDGLVVYLNGQRVATRNAPQQPSWNSQALSPRDPSAGVEVISLTDFLPLLKTGQNTLGVHLMNVAADDETLLFSAELVGVDQQGDLKYFTTPTPGLPNKGGITDFVAELEVSHPRGIYDEPFQLAITTDTAGATIRYTTDGSEPSPTHGQFYSQPLTIDRTTVVRAIAYKDDMQPSWVSTNTYLFLADVLQQSPLGQAPLGWPTGSVNGQAINYGMDPEITQSPQWGPQLIEALTEIPSFSISTDIPNLFGPQTGIYVNAGARGRAWERPAGIELINPDGTEGFGVNGGIRIRGGFSRSSGNPKHAFRLFFRSEYGGPGELNYPLFGDQGVDEFDDFDLRTTQNYSWSFQGDSRNTFLRDIFSRDVQGLMGNPYKRGEFYHLYINGQYWGLYQTDEHAEASYAANYFGGEKEDYDVVKHGGPGVEATDGDLQAYRRLWQATNAGFIDNARYFRAQGMNEDGTRNPEFERLLDVDNLIDYMIVTYYTADRDGPGSRFTQPRPNNFFGIYNRENPDGFKWFEHDSEHSLDTGIGDIVNPLTLEHPFFSSGNFNYFNPHWLHERLMENAEYRQRFADRVYASLHGNGPLTAENAEALLRSRASEIDMAIIGESARWGDAQRGNPFTKADWERAVETAVRWVRNRRPTVLAQLDVRQWYPETAPAGLLVNGQPWNGERLSEQDQLVLTALSTQSIEEPFISRSSVWYFNDSGDDLAQTWYQPDYNYLTWKTGVGPFGYGEGTEASVLDYGPDPNNKHITSYFRRTFRVTDPAEFEAVLLRLKADDGAVVYVNGTEVLRANMPSGPIDYQTPAVSVIGGSDETTFFEFQLDTDLLQAGLNSIGVEVHQANPSSTDLTFDLELIGARSLVSLDPIYYTLDGTDPRKIGGEPSPTAVLSDGQPFQVDNNVTLTARVFNDGQWGPLLQANLGVAPPPVEGELAISEIMYHPYLAMPDLGEPDVDENDFEFLEIENLADHSVDLGGTRLAGGIDFTFPSISIDPGQRLLVVKDSGAFQARYPDVDDALLVGEYSGSLSNSGETIQLVASNDQLLFSVTYEDGGDWSGRADGSGSSLELVDPQLDPNDPNSWEWSVDFGGTPGEARREAEPSVLINELLAHTDPPQMDSVELFNPTDQPIDISGWYLSDTKDDLRRYQFPDETVIPPGGYLVITAEDFNAGGGSLPTDFSLSSTGEDVWLTAADASSGQPLWFADRVEFGATFNGMALGRLPNGDADAALFPLLAPTFGQANVFHRVGELVFTEIHYNHSGDDEDREFLELLNTTGDSLDISGWRIAGGIDFVFPNGTVVPPQGVVVVVEFDPNNSARRSDFEDEFPDSEGAMLIGPWESGDALDNSGETVRIERPDEPPDGETDIPYVVIDRVAYEDASPWPVAADGDGDSLNRKTPAGLGDDPSTWEGDDPSPGVYSTITPPAGDFDWDGELTGADIDLISAALRGASSDLRFDLTDNGTFDAADRLFLIGDLMSTRPGDTDLDGDVDSADMTTLLLGWTGSGEGIEWRGWAAGDADGDGDTDSADLTEMILQWTGAQARASEPAVAVDALFATTPRRRSAFWAP